MSETSTRQRQSSLTAIKPLVPALSHAIYREITAAHSRCPQLMNFSDRGDSYRLAVLSAVDGIQTDDGYMEVIDRGNRFPKNTSRVQILAKSNESVCAMVNCVKALSGNRIKRNHTLPSLSSHHQQFGLWEAKAAPAEHLLGIRWAPAPELQEKGDLLVVKFFVDAYLGDFDPRTGLFIVAESMPIVYGICDSKPATSGIRELQAYDQEVKILRVTE